MFIKGLSFSHFANLLGGSSGWVPLYISIVYKIGAPKAPMRGWASLLIQYTPRTGFPGNAA